MRKQCCSQNSGERSQVVHACCVLTNSRLWLDESYIEHATDASAKSAPPVPGIQGLHHALTLHSCSCGRKEAQMQQREPS
jgi:hypothetical protein